MRSRISLPAITLFAALFSMTATALVPIPKTKQLPYVKTGNPETRDVAFLAWPGGLRDKGYVEEEYLMIGTANTYEYVDELSQSPEVQPTAAPAGKYRTRILVRMPKRKRDFNGVVHMEILNSTARFDGAPMWDLTYESIIDDGAAWVGVTYSEVSSAFMRYTWGNNTFPAPEGAKLRNRSRYDTLNVPTRSYTWDILNQAAALLKSDNDNNPMQGYGVDTIIASGYSQSAAFVTTYANSFYPSYAEDTCSESQALNYACDPIVDGYIVAAGGPVARRLNGLGSHPVGDRRNCAIAIERTLPCELNEDEPAPSGDNTVPVPKVMRYTTESDIDSALVRQTMTSQPNLRTYEAAGTSHVDYWGNVVGRRNSQYNFGVSERFGKACDLPLNPIRTGIPLSAIQYRLARWIEDGEEPPPSNYISLLGSFDDDSEAWERDADGNAIGGVRPARIEVPLASYSGSNPYSGPSPSAAEILCATITGSAIPFDLDELAARYSDRSSWLVINWWSIWLAWQEGFLLRVDAELLLDEVKRFTVWLPEEAAD